MSGKSVRAVLAALFVALVIGLSVHAAVAPLLDLQPTPAIMVEEHETTGG